MGAYKTLDRKDSYITVYTAQKSWTVGSDDFIDLGIQQLEGILPTNNLTQYTTEEHLHNSIRHLYYSNLDDNSSTISGSFENYLQSSLEDYQGRQLNDEIVVFSLPKQIYGTHIQPNTVRISPEIIDPGAYVVNAYVNENGDNSIDVGENQYIENVDLDVLVNDVVDDGEGRLILENSDPIEYVGNVIYPHGLMIITNESLAEYYNTNYFGAQLNWKSNLPIYTHNFHCKVLARELNHTTNKTALSGSNGDILPLINSSSFEPYITTVGLYNDTNELIAVGKLGQPIPKSKETDMSFQIKLDMNFGTKN